MPSSAAGEHAVEGEEEVGHAPVAAAVLLPPLRSVREARVRVDDMEAGAPLLQVHAVLWRVLRVEPAVQEVQMRCVEFTLEGLHPVAFVDELVAVAELVLRDETPLELGDAGSVVLVLSHVYPGHAAEVGAAVGRDPHLALEVARRRLVGHIDAVARDVELPAVVGAADAALLVPTEVEARAPVRAAVLNERGGAVGVAPRQQVLAEQAHPQWLPVARQLPAVGDRQPVAAHELAHRRAWPHLAQQVHVLW